MDDRTGDKGCNIFCKFIIFVPTLGVSRNCGTERKPFAPDVGNATDGKSE